MTQIVGELVFFKRQNAHAGPHAPISQLAPVRRRRVALRGSPVLVLPRCTSVHRNDQYRMESAGPTFQLLHKMDKCALVSEYVL